MLFEPTRYLHIISYHIISYHSYRYVHPERQHQKDAVTKEMDEIRRQATHRAGYNQMVTNLDKTVTKNPHAGRDSKATAAHIKHQEAAR